MFFVTYAAFHAAVWKKSISTSPSVSGPPRAASIEKPLSWPSNGNCSHQLTLTSATLRHFGPQVPDGQ